MQIEKMLIPSKQTLQTPAHLVYLSVLSSTKIENIIWMLISSMDWIDYQINNPSHFSLSPVVV